MTRSEDREALLRSVEHAVFDLTDDGWCGHPPTVGLVAHGSDHSVCIRHVVQPPDYRRCWRFVVSRALSMEHPLWQADGPRLALRRATSLRSRMPLLLNEPTARDTPRAPTRGVEDQMSDRDIQVTIDGEVHTARVREHDGAFGCYVIVKDTVVKISGCDPLAHIDLTRLSAADIAAVPRFWDNPQGF
jgi:hypothetical protein